MVRSGGAKEAGLLRVFQVGFQYLDDTLTVLGVFNRENALDAAKEVSGHPVGASCENMGLRAAAVFKVKDTTVLEIASEDTAHTDIFADAFDAGHEHTDTAYDQLDFNACLGSFVEQFDALAVDEAIGLNDNFSRVSRTCLSDFSTDVFLDRTVQIERSD